MKRSETGKCEDCLHWFSSDEGGETGTCKRYPPVYSGSGKGIDSESVGAGMQILRMCIQPLTTSHEWCGEFCEADPEE